jgi:rare lipoprotein A
MRGSASWYGQPFHGRKTSNGETFNMFALTAAHRTLPFGSLVRVQRMDNGRQVDVRINDRGPFIDGRVIDLSRSAAGKLGILSSGTAPVRLIPLRVPAVGATKWLVLVGGFSSRKSAEAFESRVKRHARKIRIIGGWNGDSTGYHVRLEDFWKRGEAISVVTSLRRNGYSAFLVRIQ